METSNSPSKGQEGLATVIWKLNDIPQPEAVAIAYLTAIRANCPFVIDREGKEHSTLKIWQIECGAEILFERPPEPGYQNTSYKD